MSIYDKASLVLIPSGTKTSKVFSQKPVNGDGDFTFSRSTAATRVNADGNIEKETSNLLLQSNTFNTSWNSYNLSRTAGANDFDGGTNAWTISKLGSYGLINQSVSNTGVHTFSVYAKAGTLNYIALTTSASPFSTAYFDLQNGVVGSLVNAIDSNIESVGGGWYRCSLTSNVTASGFWRIYPADSDGGLSNANLGNVIIYKAQLEQGLVARDYIETTTAAVEGGITDNVPRLDYTDSSCPALLLEPQRTNTLTHSEYSGVYSTQGLVSLTDNFATSPEGYKNAFRAIPTTSNVQHLFFRSGMGGAADTYTQSIFAKANGYNFCFIRFDLLTRYAFFDLQNGTTAYTDSNITSSITDMGNGWYRCTATMTTTNYANAVIGVAEAGNSQADKDFAGDGSSSVLFYGHQSELGSYATSYIPTYGTSVTRVVENCNKTGISSLIGQTEGTLFAEVSVDTNSVSSLLNRVISVTDGTLSNRVLIVLNTDETFRFIIIGAGSTLANITTSASALNGFHKVALAYKANDYVAYVDGVQVGSNTSAASVPSSLSQASLGSVESGATSSVLEGSVKQSLMFKTRLTNAELADLTTL